MGFSVSGSFAILVLAAFIAFGMLYTSGANSFENVNDATKASYEDDLDRQNTAIDLTTVEYDETTLEVNVRNVGTTTLAVNDTDVVVDNVYYGPGDAQNFQVADDPGTDLWRPGDELFVRVDIADAPSRVKVVTEHGVSVGGEV